MRSQLLIRRIGLWIIVLVFAMVSLGDALVHAQSDDGVRSAEEIVREYFQSQGISLQSENPEYETQLMDILLGEHPVLMSDENQDIVTEYVLDELGIAPDADAMYEVVTLHTVYLPLIAQSGGASLNQSSNNVTVPDAANKSEDEELAGVSLSAEFSYNRLSAAQYALDWAKHGGKKRNSSYPDFAQNDCTNFASQVASAGGLSQQGSGSCRYENTTAEWYVKKSSWWCFGGTLPQWAWSTSWSEAFPFRAYMRDRGPAEAYLYPRGSSGMSYLSNRAFKGDFVQLRANGSTYHTMVVTQYDGLYNVLLTYHSGSGGKDVVNKSLKELERNLPKGQEVILVDMIP